ncbi:glycogen/starch/alpha-glucan phosphorylase, partial [Enterococcus faecium]
FQVKLPCCTLQPVRYDMDVIGFDGKKNRLHLFDVESVEEGIVKDFLFLMPITFYPIEIQNHCLLYGGAFRIWVSMIVYSTYRCCRYF